MQTMNGVCDFQDFQDLEVLKQEKNIMKQFIYDSWNGIMNDQQETVEAHSRSYKTYDNAGTCFFMVYADIWTGSYIVDSII